MLLSTISSSVVSSTYMSSSSITISITPGLTQYGGAVVLGLIAILSLKEVLSASERWNQYFNRSLNVAIIPLFCSFAAIIFLKISEHI